MMLVRGLVGLILSGRVFTKSCDNFSLARFFSFLSFFCLCKMELILVDQTENEMR